MQKGYIFNIQKFCLHDGAGIRTDVFFSGCNLRCRWCANPESQLPCGDERSEAKCYTTEEVLREVLKDEVFYKKSGGGVTLTGGEVFMQYEFAMELCQKMHANGLNIAIETAGAVDPEKFSALVNQLDFVFIDCKHYDTQKHRQGTGIGNELILKNISWLVQSGKAYTVRIPVIPGYNDSLSDAKAFAELFVKLGVKEVQLLPFHQFGEKKYEKLNKKYDYKGVAQLHKEDLKEYKELFCASKISAAIGG